MAARRARSTRKVRRRRYGGVRFRATKNKTTMLMSVRPRSRATHYFKRLGSEYILGCSTVSNQPAWTTTNNSLATGTPSLDDFGTYQLGGAFKFKLVNVLQPADFGTLFDRYKIMGVKLKFLFQVNNSTGQGLGNTSPLPILTYSFDGDDAAVPSDKNSVAVKQYAKERIMNANRTFSVYIKPRVDKLVYAGAVTSGYTSERACWLDMANDSIEHYGLKFWINNWYSDAPSSSFKLTIVPTYYLACKDTL